MTTCYDLEFLKNHFQIHTLAAEDALNIPQRQKVEDYDGTLFIILRMLQIADRKLMNEQVSFFYRKTACLCSVAKVY